MKGHMFPILTITFHSTRSNKIKCSNRNSSKTNHTTAKWTISMEMYSIRQHLSMVAVTKTRTPSTSQAVQPSSSSNRCSKSTSRSRWCSSSSSNKNTWWLQPMKICKTIATLIETTTTTTTTTAISLSKTDSPLSLLKLMEQDHSDDTLKKMWNQWDLLLKRSIKMNE